MVSILPAIIESKEDVSIVLGIKPVPIEVSEEEQEVVTIVPGVKLVPIETIEVPEEKQEIVPIVPEIKVLQCQRKKKNKK